MKITDEETLKKYELHYQQSEVDFNAGNYHDSIKQCLMMWEVIPEPKYDYDVSYYAAKDLFRLYHMVGDLKEAYNWAKELLLCDLSRFDDGMREFYFGKVNYDLGNMEIAREYLTVAKKKSRSRCFINEDKKYKQLV